MNHAKRTFCVCHMSEPTRGHSCVVSGPEALVGHGSTVHDQGLELSTGAPPPMRMRAHDVIATDRDRSSSRDRSIGSIGSSARSIRSIDRYRSRVTRGRGAFARTVRCDRANAREYESTPHEAGGDVATGEHRRRVRVPSTQTVRRHKPSVGIHSFIHSFTD